MKVAFIKLVNGNNEKLMDLEYFYRWYYKKSERIESMIKEIVLYDNIYIAAFKMLETENTIKEYNENAKIIDKFEYYLTTEEDIKFLLERTKF